MRCYLIVVCIFFLSGTICFSQKLSTDNRLRQIISEDRQAEVSVPLTDNFPVISLSANVSIISIKDNFVYISLSPLTVEWFIAQRLDYLIVERRIPNSIEPPPTAGKIMNWDKYPAYSQYDSLMRDFVSRYPTLCYLDTIGTSLCGKQVLVLKISDNVNKDEEEPEVFYTSSMHGDETGGFVLMLHLIDYLLINYSVSNRVKNLIDNLEIWINPLANPDGTYGLGNNISSPTRFNANGYDLNRNFPDPFTPNTPKQIETLDMIKFMRKHRFVLSANFHSGSEVVNYPWDRWDSKKHADDSWFYTISRAYADTVHTYSGDTYMNLLDNGVTQGSKWYVIYGGRQDFVTGELQGREVTIELDNQFITPEIRLPLLWEYNYRSLLGYFENALYGIHGLVRNANTHSPVAAKVFISGHDKDSSHVYTDSLSGKFVRFLNPGLWNLTFSASGYRPVTVKNIDVILSHKTDLVVEMSPLAGNGENPDSSSYLLLYPNPANYMVNALLPEKIYGSIDIKIFNENGMPLSEYFIESSRGEPIVIDISKLPAGTYTLLFFHRNSGKTFRGRLIVIK